MRIDDEPIVIGTDAQEVLAEGDEAPGRGTAEPAVLGLPIVFGIAAGDHLRIDVRLGVMDVGFVFDIGRSVLL
jgi:hypothetical protein